VRSGKKKVIPKITGFRYKAKDGIDMVEYHVDSLRLFQDRMSATEFGGNLSVRLKEGDWPLLSFGHNKCIYKQYLPRNHGNFPWEKKLVPKMRGWEL
jgi:hypothetical protein